MSWDKGNPRAKYLRWCPDVLETLPSVCTWACSAQTHREKAETLLGLFHQTQGASTSAPARVLMPLIPGYENGNFLPEDSWVAKKNNPNLWENKLIETISLHFLIPSVLPPFSELIASLTTSGKK